MKYHILITGIDIDTKVMNRPVYINHIALSIVPLWAEQLELAFFFGGSFQQRLKLLHGPVVCCSAWHHLPEVSKLSPDTILTLLSFQSADGHQ